MAARDRVYSLVGEIVHDLKHSVRFQVATFLWVPLIVTLGVMATRFGAHHTVSERIHEWKNTYIAESTTTWPNMLLNTGNQLNVAASYCRKGDSYVAPKPVSPAADWFSPNTYQFTLDGFQQTSNDWTGGPGTHVWCQLNFSQVDPRQNDALYITFPGGIAPLPGGWNPDMTPVRPNDFVRIELQRKDFWSMNFVDYVAVWSTQIYYESDIWESYLQTPTFATTFYIHIPFRMQQVYWETVAFDSWDTIAFWGGGIFFFVLLHWAAFSIAKCFLPDDSQVLRSHQ